MKYLSNLFFISLLGLNSWAANDDEIIKSNISEVTVYMQGAQIAQKASYTVKAGISRLVIEGISPNIDANSLQVNASGSIVIIDAKYHVYYPKPEPVSLEGLPLKVKKDLALLEDSLRNINFDIQSIQDEIDLYTASKNILTSNGAIRGQGKVNDSINLLKQAVEYYLTKVNDLNKKILTLRRQMESKKDIQTGITTRLNNLRNFQNNAQLNPKPQGPSHRVTITLSAKEAATGKLHISYLVGNAGWIPLYDLRANASSEKINLNYKANVYQNTGIDWDNVKLRISTNNPYQNKTLPTLNPWYLAYNNYVQPVAYKSKQLELKKKELNYDKVESESKPMADESSYVFQNSNGVRYDAQTAADFSTMVEHMISAEFQIDLPYSIPSNGEHHMVLIQNIDIPAKYRHYSIPKLDPTAYLTAEIYNLTDYQLVPAQANIFFDGTYMGETYLKPNQMEDTIILSLGADPNVMVKRTLAKKECKEKVVGNHKEKTMAYYFEIKNIKSTPIDLTILDQIPITTNPEIEIEALEIDKGELNTKTGQIEWKLKLKPKEARELQLKYKVKHLKDQMVHF